MKLLSVSLIIIGLLCGCSTTLQDKYATTSTPQLKLRHEQLDEYLVSEKKQWEFHFGPQPLFQGDPRADRIKEKQDIETELLRRYEAGDKGAYLPMFDATQ